MFVFLYPSSRYPLQVAVAEHSGLIQLCAGLWRAVLCFMSFYKHLFCISLLLSCRAEGTFSCKHLKSHLKQEILNKWHALKAPCSGWSTWRSLAIQPSLEICLILEQLLFLPTLFHWNWFAMPVLVFQHSSISSESKESSITSKEVTVWKTTVRQAAELPANHFPVPIHRDIGDCFVIIRSKMAIWGSKPFIKPMLQGMELGPVAQMPRNKRNRWI